MKVKKLFNIALLIPALLFLITFLVAPIVFLFVLSFRNQDVYMNLLPGFTIQRYIDIFTTPRYWSTIASTIGIAILTTIICLVLAYPAAALLTYTKNRTLKSIFYVLLVSPLLTSVVVRTFAWIVLLAQNGLINQVLTKIGLIDAPLTLLWNMKAVMIAYVQVMLPFAVMPLATIMAEINPSIQKASMSLGVGRVRTFMKITLPLSIPGIISGAVIVFSLTAGSYITPLLVGGGMQPLLPLNIYQQAMQISDIAMAGALSIVLLLVVTMIVLPLEYVLKRWEERVYG